MLVECPTSSRAARRASRGNGVFNRAGLIGIRDCGRLLLGLAADNAIFDPETVGSSNRGERRYDLPGGGKRMIMPSRGVRYTIVNGVRTYADGELVGTSAGKVLRS